MGWKKKEIIDHLLDHLLVAVEVAVEAKVEVVLEKVEVEAEVEIEKAKGIVIHIERKNAIAQINTMKEEIIVIIKIGKNLIITDSLIKIRLIM